MDEWYYAADETRYGPITGALVEQLAADGVITPNTPLWCPGMQEWQSYEQLCGGGSGAATASSGFLGTCFGVE